jgi:hypothetical protein
MIVADVSPWLTPLLAVVGGGAVGSMLTTFWRTRFEREEAWRSRMLSAADDFATGALQALMKVESNGAWFWLSHEGDDSFLSPAEVDAMGEADRLVDEARARLARVHLLYGASSETGRAASDLVSALRGGAKGLWGDPDGGGIDWNAADGGLQDGRSSLDAFVENARVAAVRGDIWRGTRQASVPGWRPTRGAIERAHEGEAPSEKSV